MLNYTCGEVIEQIEGNQFCVSIMYIFGVKLRKMRADCSSSWLGAFPAVNQHPYKLQQWVDSPRPFLCITSKHPCMDVSVAQ